MLIKSSDAKKFDKPPPGYVPGISRGDTGFITRLDVGPMNIDPRLNDLKTSNNYRHSGAQINSRMDGSENWNQQPEAAVFDEWSGYSMNIFKTNKYTREDKEADKAYFEIDDFMSTRKYKKKKNKIDQFSSKSKLFAESDKLKKLFSRKNTKKVELIGTGQINKGMLNKVTNITQNDARIALSKRAKPDDSQNDDFKNLQNSGTSFWGNLNKRISTSDLKTESGKKDLKRLFVKEKQKLKNISDEQWSNLPEAHAKRANKKLREKITPVPDQLLLGSLFESSRRMEQRAKGAQSQRAGIMESYLDGKIQSKTGTDSLAMIRNGGFGKRSVLMGEGGLQSAMRLNIESKQNRMIETSNRSKGVDKIGYLTKLNTQTMVREEHNIQDIKKARLLLRSIRETKPTDEQGYLGGARIEEIDGKVEKARKILKQGLKMIPRSEDIWYEFIRLLPQKRNSKHQQKAPNFDSKSPIASHKQNLLTVRNDGTKSKLTLLPDFGTNLGPVGEISNDSDLGFGKPGSKSSGPGIKLKYAQAALKMIPHSAKLWKLYLRLCKHTQVLQVLRKATQNCPEDIFLWKQLVNKTKGDASKRDVLREALQHVHKCLDFWIALAKLSEYEEAKHVLNEANQLFGNAELKIFVAAAMLEEAAALLNLGNELVFELGIVDLQKDHQPKESLHQNETLNPSNTLSASQYLKTPESIFKDQLTKKRTLKKKIDKILKNGYKKHLKINNKILDKDLWMEEARTCEESGYPLCALAMLSLIYKFDFEGIENLLLSLFEDEELNFGLISAKNKNNRESKNTKLKLSKALSRVHEIRDRYRQRLQQDFEAFSSLGCAYLAQGVFYFGEKLMQSFEPFIWFGEGQIAEEILWMFDTSKFEAIRESILAPVPQKINPLGKRANSMKSNIEHTQMRENLMVRKNQEKLKSQDFLLQIEKLKQKRRVSSTGFTFIEKLIKNSMSRQQTSLVVSLFENFRETYQNLVCFHKCLIQSYEKLYYSDKIDTFSFRKLIQTHISMSLQQVNDIPALEYLILSFMSFAGTDPLFCQGNSLKDLSEARLARMSMSAPLLKQKIIFQVRAEGSSALDEAKKLLMAICNRIFKKSKRSNDFDFKSSFSVKIKMEKSTTTDPAAQNQKPKKTKIKVNKSDPQFFIILSEIFEQQNLLNEADRTLSRAINIFPGSFKLALAYIQLLHRIGKKEKALTQFEKTQSKYAHNELLYLTTLNLTKDNPIVYKNILKTAKNKCPGSGDIAVLNLENNFTQKIKQNALICYKNYKDCVNVLLFISRIFMRESKPEKALRWGMSAWSKEPLNMDVLAFLYIYYGRKGHAQIEKKLILEKVQKLREVKGFQASRMYQSVKYGLPKENPMNTLFLRVVEFFESVLDNDKRF